MRRRSIYCSTRADIAPQGVWCGRKASDPGGGSVKSMANAKKKRRRRWYIAGAVVFVLGAAALVMASRDRNTLISPTHLVAVKLGPITNAVVAVGRIEPYRKVEVKSKASGIVQKLFVHAGDTVHRGQLLAQLDREQLRAEVRAAQAQLQAAQAALEEARATYRMDVVEAKGPDVPFLRAAARRAKGLYAEGIDSRQSLDQAEQSYQVALNNQAAAIRNVSVAHAAVDQARANVAEQKATLADAEENLAYATIRSPIDGIVLSRNVEVGDAVSSILVLGSQATLVVTLGDMQRVYLKGKVDEADIGKVFLGQPARIHVESYPHRTFLGRVVRIAPMGVRKNNLTTFAVRVSVKNPQGVLRANMTGNGELVIQRKKHVLLIPESALFYAVRNRPYVHLYDPAAPKGFRKVFVNLGITNGIDAQVLSGISAGQKVVRQ